MADEVLAALRWAGYTVVRLSEDERDEIAMALRSKSVGRLRTDPEYASTLAGLVHRVEKGRLS
jgi:hypothetical protein